MEDIQVKIDELYEGNLDFETIIDNPILQPISEVNTIYRSQSLSVQRNLWEFEQIKIRMDEMIKLNPVYSETLILGEVQNLINTVKNIIHAQDVQRELVKKSMNNMISLNGRYYSLSRIKKEENLEIKKEDKDKMVPGFYSDIVGRTVEIPDYGIERPKKGRPKKVDEKKVEEVKIKEIEEFPKINGEEINIPKIKGPDIIWDSDIDEKEVNND